MKERPILFSTEMVQAILDGRKKQTRRVVKLPKNHRWGTEYDGQVIYNDGSTFGADIEVDDLRCQHGDIGDHLWVRETWQMDDPLAVPKHRQGRVAPFVGCQGSDEGIKRKIHWVAVYRADGEIEDHPDFGKYVWQPSIFMPRWASRILLEITALRVERLHDISEEDAIAEGIECDVVDQAIFFKNYMSKSHFADDDFCDMDYEDAAQKSYLSLWESINGRESLNSNPWVWVIEFKRIDV